MFCSDRVRAPARTDAGRTVLQQGLFGRCLTIMNSPSRMNFSRVCNTDFASSFDRFFRLALTHVWAFGRASARVIAKTWRQVALQQGSFFYIKKICALGTHSGGSLLGCPREVDAIFIYIKKSWWPCRTEGCRVGLSATRTSDIPCRSGLSVTGCHCRPWSKPFGKPTLEPSSPRRLVKTIKVPGNC